ncbi:aerobic C4-dicarboxylate transport protein, partial [Streptomyces sp. Ncost-T6T-2b]
MKVWPRRAFAVFPRKVSPIWLVSGCVQRTRSVSMIVTKAIPVSSRTRSAYGWSTADGSGVRMASRTEGESATARAATRTCRAAVSSACALPEAYANTAHPATTAAMSTTCMAKSWPARLRGRVRGRRIPHSLPGPAGRSQSSPAWPESDCERYERKGDRGHRPVDSHRSPQGRGRNPLTEPRSPTMAVAAKQRDRTHYLYIAVIAAVALGILVGFAAPGVAVELKPIGAGFVNLIKMMISPIIFCTIVLGVGSVRKAAKVGAVGGLALGYFLVMSTVALAIGLLVGNFLEPGSTLHITEAAREAGAEQAGGAGESTADFLLGIIPTTIVSAFTEGEVLQTLLVALLAGFALQAMGKTGEPIIRGITHIQRLVFRILAMIMWAAPVGAFGAIAAVVGETGLDALKSLAIIMIGFYVTCALFVFVVLGALLRMIAGVNLFSLLKYLGREFLLILSTSSSESALPRLIAKMEHMGVSKPVVGITVPTGYSFNLDGTAIYLTMSSLFIANAMGDPLSAGEQISLLVFMVIASKGAAGVTGAGLATLAGGLQSHRPELVDGVGLIVGIDRFMSEARALTNFAGNAVATVLVGHWTKEIDKDRVNEVLAGRIPFDEKTLVDDGHGPAPSDEVPEQRDSAPAE